MKDTGNSKKIFICVTVFCIAVIVLVSLFLKNYAKDTTGNDSGAVYIIGDEIVFSQGLLKSGEA